MTAVVQLDRNYPNCGAQNKHNMHADFPSHPLLSVYEEFICVILPTLFFS